MAVSSFIVLSFSTIESAHGVNMGLFKVVVHGKTTRKAVCAETLAQVIIKSREKFNIDEGQYYVVLEDDGTEVDDDEVLHELAKNSFTPICLMLLPGGVSYESTKPSTSSSTGNSNIIYLIYSVEDQSITRWHIQN